jgi:hypothetical protein
MNSKIAIAVVVVLALPTLMQGQGLGTAMSGPSPWIDVTTYGARGDAQISGDCNVALGPPPTVTCSTTTFSATDQWKSIQIPNAGVSSATFPTRISAVNPGTHTLTLVDTPNSAPSGVTVTWGTDDAAPVQNATAACPASNKGCVIYFPSGDYMFGAGVSMTTQTSFEIIAQGNGGRQQSNQQSGVRLLTAMPNFPIMTLGSITSSNWGGFQLWNFTFMDTSGNGSVTGGLDIINTSDPLIAESDFEHFNGVGHYGMKAELGNGSVNNIFLLHDKGKDNVIWYDGTATQDGPIVIGGDIFPSIATPNGPCYGVKAAGPVRIFGTHFDVGTDTSGTPIRCFGVQAVGGQIYGKFEASDMGHEGDGVELPGTAAGVEVDGIFNNEVHGVIIRSGAKNNRIVVMVGANANTFDVSDNSGNNTNTIEIHGKPNAGNSFQFAGPLGLSGSTMGTTTLQASSTASGTLTLPAPATSDILVGRGTTDTLTNKTLASPAFSGTASTGLSLGGNLTLTGASPSILTSTNINLLLTPGGTGGVQVPNGATATPAWFMPNGPGFYSPSSGVLVFQSGASSDQLAFSSTGLNTVSTGVYGWRSGSVPNGAADTGLSRDSAAGVINFGTGSNGSTAGSWKANAGTLGVATGTAPLVVTSTTPVANLTTVPTTYDHSGTQKTGTRIVADSGTLSGGTLTVNFTGAAIFGGAGNYFCTANDTTGPSAIEITYNTGAQVVFTGNGTHSFRYVCIGN